MTEEPRIDAPEPFDGFAIVHPSQGEIEEWITRK